MFASAVSSELFQGILSTIGGATFGICLFVLLYIFPKFFVLSPFSTVGPSLDLRILPIFSLAFGLASAIEAISGRYYGGWDSLFKPALQDRTGLDKMKTSPIKEVLTSFQLQQKFLKTLSEELAYESKMSHAKFEDFSQIGDRLLDDPEDKRLLHEVHQYLIAGDQFKSKIRTGLENTPYNINQIKLRKEGYRKGLTQAKREQKSLLQDKV